MDDEQYDEGGWLPPGLVTVNLKSGEVVMTPESLNALEPDMRDILFERGGDMTCSRCGNLTGNNTQGHYWSFCKVERRYTKMHFCCPGNCELRRDDDDQAT